MTTTAADVQVPHSIGPIDLEAHRTALTGHCYRMLGSVTEADDAVQETMIRAWRALDRFDGRSSLRTWLTRIATNVCLDALNDEKYRARPFEEGPCGTVDDELAAAEKTHWLEPVPDAVSLENESNPARRVLLRESIRLAFVAALQHLPPRQRAALLLADVLDHSASEIAETLNLTTAAVNSALQRARATLTERSVHLDRSESLRGSDEHHALLARFVEAFERYDVEALTSLCREDVVFSMPPYRLWLQGTPSVGAWLSGRGAGCRGSRVIVTAANGAPAYGQYRRAPDGSGYIAWGLGVLEVSNGRIERWNTFLDVATLFPRFGLALSLPA
ncbi:MAG: sigma-70 family RNA polymerase sigma factor [Polyangiaceae bacterium]|nr:sigma-70 family RNA polymerase sigma factor [Polyangiaceae bacterium]